MTKLTTCLSAIHFRNTQANCGGNLLKTLNSAGYALPASFNHTPQAGIAVPRVPDSDYRSLLVPIRAFTGLSCSAFTLGCALVSVCTFKQPLYALFTQCFVASRPTHQNACLLPDTSIKPLDLCIAICTDIRGKCWIPNKLYCFHISISKKNTRIKYLQKKENKLSYPNNQSNNHTQNGLTSNSAFIIPRMQFIVKPSVFVLCEC